MAIRVLELSLALALTASVLLAHRASAQPSTCTTAIVSLAPCLGYITGNSSAPSSSCCTQLDSVVKTQARCLCTLLSGGASSFGLSINQTQALALPGACKVQTPPVSQCNAAAPAESPAATPDTPAVPSTPTTPSTPADSSPAAPSAPSTPKVPSGKGSSTVPTTESSDGSSYRSTSSMMLSTLFLVLCISSLAL